MILPKEKMLQYFNECVNERLRDLYSELYEQFKHLGFNLIGLTGAEKIASWLGFEAAIKFHESPLFQTLKLTDPIELCSKMRSGELEEKIGELYQAVSPRLIAGGFSIELLPYVSVIEGGPNTYLLYVDDPLNCVVTCGDTICAEVVGGELEPRKTDDYGEKLNHWLIGCNQPVLVLDTRNPSRWSAMWV